jgi:predicted MFS family arabinose efflux permease
VRTTEPKTLGLGWLLTLLTTLKLILNTAFRFVYPFLPALGRGLGVDLATMGRLLSVRWAAGMAIPLAVTAVDRGGRSRRLLVAGLIVFGLGSLVTAVTGVLVGAVVGFALIGLGKPLFDVGSQTYVSERVPYQKRARSLGVLELAWAGGLLLGAPVTGWLIATWDWTVPFWMLGSVALMAVGLVVWLLEPSDHGVRASGDGLDRSIRQVSPFLLVAVMVGFAHEILLVVLGAWLEDAFAMTLAGLAAVGSLLGVAELTGEGSMVAFTDRIGKRNSYGLGLGMATAGLAVLALVHGELVPAIVALFVVGVSFEFSIISGIPLASEMRPTRRARFLSIAMVAGGLGRVLGDLTGPALFDSGGMGRVAVVSAVSAGVAAVVLLATVHEVPADGAGVAPLH